MAQVTTGNTAGGSGSATTATTGAITVASGEALVVCIVIEDPDFTVTGVTWDVGTPEDFVESPIALYQPPHGRQSVHIWELLDPTAATDTITVTTSDAENFGVLAVVVANGDGTTLLSGRVVVEGDPDNTLTVAPNQGANDLALALYATREKEALTTDAGTEIIEIEAANSFNMSLSTIDGSGAIDITVSNTVSSECEMVGMVLNEAAAGDQNINVGQASEADTAQAITITGALGIAVGQAAEADTAQAITVSTQINIAVGQAAETDLAQPIALGQALFQTQDQFQWYNDDGVEALATTIGAQNEDLVQAASIAAILRYQVNNTGDAPAQQMVLQVKKTSEPDSAYIDVPVAA